MNRLTKTLVVASCLVLFGATPALADPPGPTDYLSEVTEIDPAVDGIEMEIIGGDSFVLLTVDPGITVDVVGYAGEPYLRFLADGTVEENRWAPSKYLNEDRYGAIEMPDRASADAEPEWVVVADDGSYAWHDHRTHWMNETPPPNRGPGDQVAEGVVPVFVDRIEVDVTVVSIWQAPPSRIPVLLGLLVGGSVAVIAWTSRPRVLDFLVLVMSLAATFVGAVAYWSTPSETGPPWSLWVLPATALVFSLLVATRLLGLERHRSSLLLIATLELAGWGIAHLDWLWPAILPTSLPFWLDRLIASGVLVGAVGAATAVLLAVAAPNRRFADGS